MAVFIVRLASAQQTDTLAHTNTIFITDRMEDVASSVDGALDYSDLVDDYVYYAKNRLNLNDQDDIDKLLELNLINHEQANQLRIYIITNGPLLSLMELKYINGFDAASLQIMLPFVRVSKKKYKQKINIKQVFEQGRHQIIFRFGSLLQKSMAYDLPPDSAVDHPGSVYLGSPQKLYLRYGFNFRNKIKAGFLLEKDAGEVLFKSKLPDTINTLVGKDIGAYSDFSSAYVYVSDMGLLKKAVVGDYHLEFGQGLCLWTGLSFGKSADAIFIKKQARGLRPNTSVNENRFFRGAASSIGVGNFIFTGFYSLNKVDANLLKVDTTENGEVSGIIETGNHRTINELLHKDALHLTAFGGHLQYRGATFTLGATYYQTRFDNDFVPVQRVYKNFAFAGSALNDFGFDADLVLGKWEFFGEMASNDKVESFSGIAGINAYLSDRFTLSIYYRNISKTYHNFYSNPLTESSSLNNETGLYMGISSALSSHWNITAYADYFRFIWLKYRVDGPSQGRALLTQINFNPMRNLQAYFRFRYKQKQENAAGVYDFLNHLTDTRRYEWRWNLYWQLLDFLILKNRVEYVQYAKENIRQQGFLVYQDVLYRPENFPLQFSLRFALFDTDGWDSRIYAYENDVLYAFSIPAYYDKGQRFYLMLKWQVLQNVNVWLRFAQTLFYNKTVIGSGPDEIRGNNKSDIKIQLIWKVK